MKDAVRDHKQVLGGSARARSAAQDELVALLEQIGEETAEFSPMLDVSPLTAETFAIRKVDVPPAIDILMPRFKFFLVQVPITLVPRTGWSFDRLECRVQFKATSPGADLPVAHEIFPQPRWKHLLSAHTSLEVGVDEGLSFKADASSLPVGAASLPATAALTVSAKASAGFVAGPFTYTVRRPEIRASGQGDAQVVWRLEGSGVVDEERPSLGIVLKVPQAVEDVEILGAFKARHSFNVLAATFGELLDYVRKTTRTFFRAGAPVSDTHRWVNVIGGL